MKFDKWILSFTILLILFIYVLLRYEASSNQIERAIESLSISEDKKVGKKHFILIGQEYDNPYWKSVNKGAKDSAKKYDINIEYVAPLRTSVDEQLKLLEKAVASKVDGIIVQSIDNQKFTPIINQAISKNIPVITIDTDAPDSLRKSYIGTDNYKAGIQLGQTVAQMTNGKGNIGIIIGSETSESQKMRLNGLLNVINQYPNLHVVDRSSSNISKIQASLQAERMLRKYDNINIMVGISALDAIGISNATNNVFDREIQIYGFDGLEETMKGIIDHKIKATIVQKPYDMGYKGVELLYKAIHGEQIVKINHTPTEVITSDNVLQEVRH
ncbi:sugar-binding protein [Bacillus sp. JJ664]